MSDSVDGSPFSLTRDFSSIRWGATLGYNLLRSVMAGVVWTIVFLVLSGADAQSFQHLIGVPLVWLLVVLPFNVVVVPLVRPFEIGRSIAGFVLLFLSLFYAPGDPLVRLLKQYRPDLVPVESPPWISLNSVFWVFGNAGAPSSKSSDMATSLSAPRSNTWAVEDDIPAPYTRFEAARQELAQAKSANDTELARSALLTLLRLSRERLPVPELYVLLPQVLLGLNSADVNSDEILSMLRFGHDLDPARRDIHDRIEVLCFAWGKFYWDGDREAEAFDAYMQGLRYWSESGNSMSQSAPLLPRIAFRAVRMFSRTALDAGNTALGVEFLDYCENTGVDMNMKIDISDAKLAS